MAEYLFGQRQAQRFQHNGPNDGMEANDLLADQMHIRRPVFLEFAVVLGQIAQRRDVIGQRIRPYVDNVFFVKRHGDAPVKAGTGYGQIL